MKKNITAKNKQRASHRMTVGVDLGDRSSRYCIVDEGELPGRNFRDGEVWYEVRNLRCKGLF